MIPARDNWFAIYMPLKEGKSYQTGRVVAWDGDDAWVALPDSGRLYLATTVPGLIGYRRITDARELTGIEDSEEEASLEAIAAQNGLVRRDNSGKAATRPARRNDVSQGREPEWR